MWNHPEVRDEWLRVGEERGMKVHLSRNFDGKPYVTHTEMKGMAEIITRRYFKRLDIAMICAIVEIESSRQPLAYRFEPKLNEASTGLMQTLQSTAEWLATDMGYRAYAIENVSALLYRPFVSVYFGCAYLKWLSTYDGKKRSEEFMVRGYNGGPQAATKTSTLSYWNKYLQAKQSLPDMSESPIIFVTPVPSAPPLPMSPVIAPPLTSKLSSSTIIPPPPPDATRASRYQHTIPSSVGESMTTISTSSSIQDAIAELKAVKLTITPAVESMSSTSTDPVLPHKRIKPKLGPAKETVVQPKAKASTSANAHKTEWTYWDEKVSPEDLNEMWRHPQVKKEWTSSNEKRGQVRFARDGEHRPYLTTTELKAVVEIIVSRYFAERVSPIMLRTIAEISSKRLLHGADGLSGLMQTAYPTAAWLYKDMGYKAYKLKSRENLSNPFLAMYFGAAYVCWLTNYSGRPRTDEFVLRAYYAGPSGVDEPAAGIFYQKYLAQRQQVTTTTPTSKAPTKAPPTATTKSFQKSSSMGGQWTTSALWKGTDPAFQPPPNQSIWRRLWATS